jgi:hypothetical protein
VIGTQQDITKSKLEPMGTQDVARAMRQALAGQRAAAVPEAEVH